MSVVGRGAVRDFWFLFSRRSFGELFCKELFFEFFEMM